MTSSSVLRLRALYVLCHDGFWKSDHDFLIAFHSNFSSEMHSFRDNEILLQTGYDVIVISPLGGVSRRFCWQNLKEQPLFHNYSSLMKNIYLLFYASDSGREQHLQTDTFFELISIVNDVSHAVTTDDILNCIGRTNNPRRTRVLHALYMPILVLYVEYVLFWTISQVFSVFCFSTAPSLDMRARVYVCVCACVRACVRVGVTDGRTDSPAQY